MLVISSATSRRISSSSARAMSRRWSWPPLSWWGNLPSTWSGLSRTSRRAVRTRSAHSPSGTPGWYDSLIIANTRSALNTGLNELNGSWKMPWTSR